MRLSTSLLRLVMVPGKKMPVTFRNRVLLHFSLVLKFSSLSKSLDELSRELHKIGALK